MTRARALDGARIGFLLLAVACAWWGFRGRWGEVGDAAAAVGSPRTGLAVVGALVGLALTGALWRSLLAALGSRLAPADAAAVFFAGQLGKYVPGSVWSFAAQADLGRRHGVPARASVAASALFLMVHTASGLLLGSVLAAGGAVTTDLHRGWWLLLAALAAASLAPPFLRRLGDRLAGAGVRTRLGAADLLRSLALMAAVWACYGASAWALLPGLTPEGLPTAVAAFALAHAAGVLLVVAPAGLGAREAVLVALLAPAVGVPAAAAGALLVRAAHTLADVVLAATMPATARRTRAREVVGARDA